MSKKLNDALQQAYIEGMQLSLASMNEAEYCLRPLDMPWRDLGYGTPFFLFRGRIFASEEEWAKWLVDNARLQLHKIDLREDTDLYEKLWDQHKKMRKNLDK